MQFSDQQIEKFIELYNNRFGIELDRKVAFEYAEKLYRIVELTYQQISVSDYEELQRRQEDTKV